MKLIHCPKVGTRPASEFVYGGLWRPMPDPDNTTDVDWSHYVFHRYGAPGVQREWWCHAPTGMWFVAERDTVKDEFLRTFTVAEAKKDVTHG